MTTRDGEWSENQPTATLRPELTTIPPAPLRPEQNTPSAHLEPRSERNTLPYADAFAAGPLPARGSFGRYELLGEAQVGGMGIVYKARDTALDRIVALKLLKAGTLAGEDEIARFQREARAVGRLKHPHIVPIHDVALEQGLHYLSMEYLSGGSLAQHVSRLSGRPRACAELVAKVARAVHYAHEQNILHRDLKPANILLDHAGEPCVSDFGLAKFLDAPKPETERSVAPSGPDIMAQATPECKAESPALPGQTLGVVGTPRYMSPEQLTAQPVTPATDVWALGVILYELLTGRPPFLGHTRESLQMQIVGEPPPAPRQLCPGLNPALQRICLKCLEKDPSQRYVTAGALADDLAKYLHQGQLLARAWRLARQRPMISSLLVVILAGLSVLVGLSLRTDDPERVLQAIQTNLANGKAVTLIGPKGGPGWFQRTVGDVALQIIPVRDQTFTLHSPNISLLELLPDPQVSSYRFSAEIRQRDVVTGTVGLYVGHNSVHTSHTDLHWLYYFGFYDHPANGRAPAEVGFNLCCQENQAFLESGTGLTASCLDYRDKPAFGNWRRLAVEVTSDRVRVFWEGRELKKKHDVPLRLGEQVQDFRQSFEEELQTLGFTRDLPDPPWRPRSGLGFIVRQCTASFRNVVITPLARENSLP
jgi:serine/threonine-protein kinase